METYLCKSYYMTHQLRVPLNRAAGGIRLRLHHRNGHGGVRVQPGLAYQIQDDILDFTAVASVLGKPALADMDLGLSTAPILYAAMEHLELRPLVKRRFKNKGEKETALEYLYKSETAMNKAKNLAQFQAQVHASVLSLV